MCKSYVYFLTDDHGHIKIGKANDVFARMNELQTGNPFKLRPLLTVEMKNEKDAFDLEQALHREFKNSRLEGEWFKEDDVLDLLECNFCEVENFTFFGRGVPLRRYDSNNTKRQHLI